VPLLLISFVTRWMMSLPVPPPLDRLPSLSDLFTGVRSPPTERFHSMVSPPSNATDFDTNCYYKEMRHRSLLAGEEQEKISQLIATKTEYAEVFGWPNRSNSFLFFFDLYSKVDKLTTPESSSHSCTTRASCGLKTRMPRTTPIVSALRAGDLYVRLRTCSRRTRTRFIC
jgi:hypothetical protein